MDVLVGPTFAINVPSSPPPSYGGEHPSGDANERAVSFSPFGDGFSAGESSEASSSIGTPDDSSSDENDVVSPKRDREEEEEEEVQSKFKGLDSLDSLEDSLPIKKGLSSHFIGKSKSFTDLSQVTTVKELQKQENPFNKKRRILIATKRARRSSFYSWTNPQSMPLLPVVEDEYECETEKTTKVSPSSSSSSTEEKEEEKPIIDQVLLRQQNRVPHSYAAHMRLRLGSFKSRSFSLADLQEHDEEEDEDEEEEDNEHLG